MALILDNGAVDSSNTLDVDIIDQARPTSGSTYIGAWETVSGGASAALTGKSATSSEGSLSVAVAAALTGQSVTASKGTLTPATGVFAALTGESATASKGSLGVTAAVALSGESSTATQGSLKASTAVSLSGHAATASKGSLSVAASIALAGEHATASQGTLGTSGGAVAVSLTGFEIQGLTGSLSVPVVKKSKAAGRRKEVLYSLEYEGERYVFRSLDALYEWFLKLDRKETKDVKKKAKRDAKRILRTGRKREIEPPKLPIIADNPEILEGIREIEKHIQRAYEDALMSALGRDAEEENDIMIIASLDL